MLEGVSDRGNKVYDAMKGAGLIGEEKMANADRITQMCKMARTMVLAGLQAFVQGR